LRFGLIHALGIFKRIGHLAAGRIKSLHTNLTISQRKQTSLVIMNCLTANLTERLARNDPSVTEVCVRRLPLTSISPDEIVSIVEALQYNTVVKSVDLSIPDASALDIDYTAVEDNERIPVYESYSYLLDTLNSNTGIDALTVRHVETDAAWTALCTGLQRNSVIQEVSLGNNTSVTATGLSATACEAMQDLLMHTRTIQCLSLKCFELGNRQSVEALCKGVQANQSLQELVLQQIETEHFFLLLEALARTEAPLEKLSIIDCDLNFVEGIMYGCVHPLTSLVSSTNLTTLKELRITESMLGSTEVAALCEGMKINTTVQLLDLSGCDLLADACKPIADMLATNKPLRHLLLRENIIGDHGISLLCQSLAVNSSLETIDFTANHITGEGCARLAVALESPSCHVQSLIVSENAISDEGAAGLGAMLPKNSHLSSLNLDACMISDVGIGALCQGLAFNSSVRELNLSNNWCKAGSHVADMLAANTTLESLDMSSCHIADGTITALLQTLKEGANKTIKQLFLSFNAFGNAGAKQIADMLLGGNKLATLSVQFNAFDMSGLRDIGAALSTNNYLKSLFFWNGSTSIDQDCQLLSDMEHWLALNRAGRCAVTECTTNKPLWADILWRADSVYGPTALFCLLQEMPDLMESAVQGTS
jgi:Ran GTPase-activating protein (RanGAP) involved in mRNA processing and transport